MFYLVIIAIVMAGALISSVSVSIALGTISLFHAIVFPFLALLYVLILLGILDLALRFCIPKSWFDYEKKYFSVGKREVRFYEKLKIRKWKDKVPELGKSAGFSKRNLQSSQAEYLKKFIFETCIGEILHLSSALLGFTALFVFPAEHFFFVLPIAAANFVLNMLCCLIQRYNRARLVVVYRFRTRHAAIQKEEIASESPAAAEGLP